MFAVFLQVLASHLSCITGLGQSHVSRPPHPSPAPRSCLPLLPPPPQLSVPHTLYHWVALYPLYILSKIAIIATNLAELLRSAIALYLLFQKLQLWHGMLITTANVLLLLLFGNPLRGRPVRMFKWAIAAM
ncbi:hypothetical protein H0H87_010319, partial [Tephrocybe sp. NHM501043]